MQRHCFRPLLGHLHVPGEIANNDYAKFWGVKEVYYGICASREYVKIQLDNEAKRTETKEMNKHGHSISFVCVL